MTVTRRLARPMLASSFIFGGVQALKNTPALAVASKPVNDEIRGLAQKVAPQINVPADDKTLVRINAGIHIVAGLGLATGRAPRLCSLALAATLVPTTVAGHPFWKEKDKEARAKQTSQFYKNLSMLGGLVLAGLDTEGRPGIAWRTSHAVGNASKAVGAAGVGVGAATKGVTTGVGAATKGAATGVATTAKGVTKGSKGSKGGGKASAKRLTRSARKTARKSAKSLKS
jgi:putative oxidoreductase